MSTLKIRIEGSPSKEIFFSFRENSVGDSGVIQQIFFNKDYDISRWEQGRRLIKYHQDNSVGSQSLTVDVGANIGASAVYFSQSFKRSVVFNVEPDDENYRLLVTNTQSLNCINFLGAISSQDGELFLTDPGRSDWGFMTSKSKPFGNKRVRTVPSISPPSILSLDQTRDLTPLIFKIDIEGAEDELFSQSTDWMRDFPLIIIELHDWMLPFKGSSKNFFKAMAKFDFDFLYRGENIFLFNEEILGVS